MEIIDTPTPGGSEKDLDSLILNGYDVKIGDYISEGYDIFKQNMGPFIGYSLIAGIAVGLLSYTFVGSILVAGPFAIGSALVAHRIAMKKEHRFEDFFNGFEFFLPLMLATLIMSIFVALGFIFLIIPGIYLAVAYSGVYYLIVFRKMDFWQAMEYSRKIVSKEWFSIFGLGIVLGLINLGGALLFGIGMFFTIPITACAAYAAYKDIAGVRRDQP